MTDIFDAKISCKNCGIEMKQGIFNKGGYELRAVKCERCGDKIIHPADLNGLEHFNDLRGKTFTVKLRMVGNSHAISIPKEIVEFINDQHKQMKRHMDDMVKLCFEDFDTIKLRFGEDYDSSDDEGNNLNKGRIKRIRRFE